MISQIDGAILLVNSTYHFQKLVHAYYVKKSLQSPQYIITHPVHNTLKVWHHSNPDTVKYFHKVLTFKLFSYQFPKPLSPFNRQLSSLDVRHTPIITRTNRVWLAEDTFFALGMNRISWSCTRCCHCSVKKCFVVTASDINRFMRYLAKGGQAIVFFNCWMPSL